MPSWWRRGWRVSRDAVRRARSNLSYYLIALFLAAVPVWQLVSGTAPGPWWSSRLPTRRDDSGAYWFVLAAQGAILVAFFAT